MNHTSERLALTFNSMRECIEYMQTVKPEVFPFLFTHEYQDADYIALEETEDLCISTDLNGDYRSTRLDMEYLIILLDEMLDHFIYPKDVHNNKFKKQFVDTVKT